MSIRLRLGGHAQAAQRWHGVQTVVSYLDKVDGPARLLGREEFTF
jgi:hypothetical protein